MNNVLIEDVCSLWALRFLCPYLEEVEFVGHGFDSELTCDSSEHPFCQITNLKTILKFWPKVREKLSIKSDCFLTLLSASFIIILLDD